MKHFLLLFTCLFTLTSCFSSENTEKSDNHSWTIISENTTQTESETTEDQESHPISTHYTVSVEKSYFYTHPDDTEPRKAYVMRWDILEVNHEKSTENMIFAVYTNSEGKTTEGYLKRNTLQPIKTLSMEEIQSVSQCYRQYKIVDNSWNQMMAEFYFVWECKKQNNIKTVSYDMDSPIFILSSWQKVYARMFSKKNPPSDGIDGGAGIYKSLGKDTFVVQWNQVSLKKYVADDGENPPHYWFDIEVTFKSSYKSHSLVFETHPFFNKKEMEEQYTDMVWTMKNWFFIEEA